MVKRTSSRKGRGGGDWAAEAARINAMLPPRRKEHVVDIADMKIHDEPSLAAFESKLAERTGAVEPEQFSQGLLSKLASKFTKKSGGRRRRTSKKSKRNGRKSKRNGRKTKKHAKKHHKKAQKSRKRGGVC